MSNSLQDRNQLFREFALSTRMVDPKDLAQVEPEGKKATDSPLGETLISRGMLADDDRQLIDALVDSHLRRRGSAAEATHRSLGIGTIVGDNSTIVGSDSSVPLPSTDAIRGEATPNRGRFRVVREHARGGLGIVSVAIDGELNREVMLKEIRAELCHAAENQWRFLAEAEITGGLEHPGVVPVYGLGRDSAGRPFYAMRYIHGEELGTVVKRFQARRDEQPAGKVEPGQSGEPAPSRTNVEFRKLLGRFVDVCNVIEYSHSRGVLHRDLKPANIMLGDFGETIVVDWGLAKTYKAESGDESKTSTLLRPESASHIAATMMGQVAGTPAYMSPEQALGWVDKLGPACDVYSLGATLYYVLTGHSPFETEGASNSVEDVLTRVIEGRFMPPVERDRHVPKPLNAICLKAMAVKPADRYATASELAGDIENWLADEAVAAYAEPLPARVSRWGRRHRVLTSSLAVLLLTSVVGLSVGLAAVRQEQLRTEDRRVEAVAATNAAVTARKEADRQADLAAKNAVHARSQNKLALDTLDSVVLDIQRSLESVPGAHAIRGNLLRTALKNLEKVAQGLNAAPQADRGIAHAYLDLGDVVRRAGGAPGVSATKQAADLYRKSATIFGNLALKNDDAELRLGQSLALQKLGDVTAQQGRLVPAANLYRKALDVVKTIAKPKVSESVRSSHLSEIHGRLGYNAVERGDLDAAETHFREKLRLDQLAVSRDNLKVGNQRNLAVAYDRLALLNTKRNKLAAAAELFGKAKDIRAHIVAARPNDVKAQRDLSVAHLNLGDIARSRGQFTDARKSFESALEIARKSRQLSPDDREIQRDISILCERLGDACQRAGEDALARKYFAEKFAINNSLAGFDSADARARRDLSLSYERLGESALKAGRLDEAREYFQKKLRLDEALVKADPDSVDDRRNLGIANSKLGEAAVLSGDLRTAVTATERCYLIGRQLVKKSPKNTRFLLDLSQFCRQLAELRQAVGNVKDATALFEQMRDIALPLTKQDGENAEAQRQLAAAYDGLGELSRRGLDLANAGVQFEKALKIRRQLAKNASDYSKEMRAVMVSLRKCGTAAFLQGKTAEAHRIWKDGMEIARKRFQKNPASPEAQRELSAGCEQMGNVTLQMRDYAAARKYLEEKLRLDRGLAKSQPNNISDGRNLGIVHQQLGDLNLRLRNDKETDANYRECLRVRESLSNRFPGNLQLLSDLMIAYQRLGNFENNRYRYDKAADWWAKGVAVIERLDATARNQRVMQARLKFFQQRLGVNRLAAKAVDDAGFAAAQPERAAVQLLAARGLALAVRGKLVESTRSADGLASRTPPRAGHVYDAARIYGQCVIAVARNIAAKPTDDQKQQLATYADRCLELLKQAEKLGHFATARSADSLRRSRDFLGVANRKDFQAFVARLPMSKR